MNSFGFGGANAHVVLEDAAHYLERHGLNGIHCTTIKPRLPGQTNGYHTVSSSAHQNGHILKTNGTSIDGHHENGVYANGIRPKSKLFVLSSSDRDGVKRNFDQLRAYLQWKEGGHDHSLLESLAYTLAERRTTMPWKSFVVASDIEGLITSLQDNPAVTRSSDSHAPKIAFVFTGQGAQWTRMGKDLSGYAVYHHTLVRCENILQSLGCEWSLLEEMNRSETESNLHLAAFSQPACTALQIALVELLHH